MNTIDDGKQNISLGFADMHEVGHRLFAKIHKRKKSANHSHEIHFLAREIDEWLPQGIQSMIDGHYTPRHLNL